MELWRLSAEVPFALVLIGDRPMSSPELSVSCTCTREPEEKPDYDKMVVCCSQKEECRTIKARRIRVEDFDLIPLVRYYGAPVTPDVHAVKDRSELCVHVLGT